MDVASATVTSVDRPAARWHPLRLDGTALAPPLLLAARLLVVYLSLRTLLTHGLPVRRVEVFLSFIPVLDVLHGVAWLPVVSGVVFFAASLAVLVGWQVRTACVVLGLLVIGEILADRTAYSNSFFFFGCLLFLIGLQTWGRAPWLVRWQIVLVYVGAGLNKLLDPDWQSGQYVAFWTREVLDHTLFLEVAGWLPDGVLAQSLAWFVIAAELGLAVLFAVPAWWRYAIPAGVAFHGGLLVFTAGQLSVVFFFLMSVSYLAFVTWPDEPVAVRVRPGTGAARLARLLRWGDVDGRYVWETVPEGPWLAVRKGGVWRTGLPAFGYLLAYNPLSYLAGTLGLLALRYGPAYAAATLHLLGA